MANTKSAKKRTRQIIKRTAINSNRRSSVKTAVKNVLKAIEKKAAIEDIKKLFKDAEAKLARAKNKIMHKRASSRKVSRLAKKVSAYVKSQ